MVVSSLPVVSQFVLDWKCGLLLDLKIHQDKTTNNNEERAFEKAAVPIA